METKWVVVIVAIVMCLISSSLAYITRTKPPPPPAQMAPQIEWVDPPLPRPTVTKVTKPPVVKKPVQTYSVIMPVPFPSYPVGMYDWFGMDQSFYRTYPDQRWVVQPWRTFRQPGYPDKVYRA